MKQYQDLLKSILEHGAHHTDRTGVGTISHFGYQTRFDLRAGFPIVTTKRVPFRWVAEELFWMLSGSTNEQDLRAKGVDIWKEWADEDGELGPIYGAQWRHWGQIYDITPRRHERTAPFINTPFNKLAEIDFSSNESGLVGKSFPSATGVYTVIREHRIPRKGGYPKGYLRFDVKFVETGFLQKNCTKAAILDGLIRDRYAPTVLGVGCLGEPVSRDDHRLLYQTWHAMLNRCYNQSHPGYPNYGGSGIFVSNDWLIFSNFARDAKQLRNWALKKEYPQEYTLDKDFFLSNCYSVGSCIWLSKHEQNLNTRRVSLIEATDPTGRKLMRMGLDTLCQEFGFKEICVAGCLKGKQRTHHGWTFRHADEIKNPRIRIFDQIKTVIAQLKHDPNSRRIIVSAWNVSDLDNMSLQPCHSFFQFKVERERVLHCQLYQRSADAFLGVPFNISSYALLTHLVAHVCGLEVGEFVYTLGDYHIYTNHRAQVEELLSREPLPLPRLEIKDEDGKLRGLEGLLSFRYEHLQLVGYKSHGKIEAPVAV